MANVILCGRTHQIGDVVMEKLKPEYEVLAFIMSPEQGIAEIPSLLNGDKSVYAILTGGGFDDEEFAKVKAAADAAGCKPLPWLRPDKTKPRPADVFGGEYAKLIAQRARDGLESIKEPNSGEVVWY